MGVPNVALAEMANLWGGVSTPLKMAWVAVGNGDKAFEITDTELKAEITDSGLKRVAVTATRVTTNVDDDTTQLTTTFSVTGAKTITEVIIVNAATAGIIGSRTVLATPKDVVDGSSYTLTHKTIFARE